MRNTPARVDFGTTALAAAGVLPYSGTGHCWAPFWRPTPGRSPTAAAIPGSPLDTKRDYISRGAIIRGKGGDRQRRDHHDGAISTFGAVAGRHSSTWAAPAASCATSAQGPCWPALWSPLPRRSLWRTAFWSGQRGGHRGGPHRRNAVVAAGAVVIGDVPAVAGSPARIINGRMKRPRVDGPGRGLAYPWTPGDILEEAAPSGGRLYRTGRAASNHHTAHGAALRIPESAYSGDHQFPRLITFKILNDFLT